MRNSIGYRFHFATGRSAGSRRAAFRFLLIALAVLLSAAFGTARAQTVETAGNRFVRATVATPAGKFWIAAGPDAGSYRFLYGNAFFVTSNIIFRVSSGGSDYYYSNIPLDFPFRPKISQDAEVDYTQYSDIHVSDDTIALTWTEMKGFTVTMRLIAEKQVNEFDKGGDMLIEFSYTLDPLAPPATLGIFMMLDSYNSQAGGVTDESSILTSDRYFADGNGGELYPTPTDSIPEFYQVGNFNYTQPLNSVLAIHRLKGFSHAGKPLTPPTTFAVSDWAAVLRDVSWNMNAAQIESTPISDCATAMRWEGLAGNGTIRTAFGTNDRDGNNLYHGRDSGVFVDVRTTRIVEQAAPGGAYTPAQFDVNMWVANLDVKAAADISIRLDSIARADGLVLDASAAAAQSVTLPAGATGRLRWRITIPPGLQIARADVPLNFSFRKGGDSVWSDFRDPCTPVVTIKGFRAQGQDSLPPVITLTGSGPAPSTRWTYRTFDRHPGYADDSGIDTARVMVNLSQNMKLVPQAPINRCTVSADANLVATVIDSLRAAKLVFAVYDCKGNVAYDSASYTPVTTDTLPPVITRADSTKGQWVFRASDRHANYLNDTGIDTIRIEADRTTNFTLVHSSFTPCDTAVTVNLTAILVDTAHSGKIVFTVVDCAGNVSRDSVVYVHATTGVDTRDAVAGYAAMAILEIRPQPLVTSAGRTFELALSGMRGGVSHGEIIASNGSVAARFELEAGAGAVVSRTVRLPGDLPAGIYIVRIVGQGGVAAAKLVVID